MTDKTREQMKNLLKIGTPECAIFMGFLGLVLGVLFLLLGFFKTLLVALIVLVFAFIGGVSDKKKYIGKLINRVFPAKNDNFPGIEQAGKNKRTTYAPTDEFRPFDASQNEETASARTDKNDNA